jgi:cold shock CspA family protein
MTFISMRQGCLRAHQRGRTHWMSSLNEGQKVTFEVVADRRTGKASAENLRAA